MTLIAVISMPRRDPQLLTSGKIDVPAAFMSQLNSDLCRQRKIS
jgi:hypothetical protein